jgi:prevent-host-death family protein
MTEYIEAEKFKAECLTVMDRVKRTRKKIIITKHNVPLVQLIPVEETAFGRLKGTVHFKGNIIDPVDEWNANS